MSHSMQRRSNEFSGTWQMSTKVICCSPNIVLISSDASLILSFSLCIRVCQRERTCSYSPPARQYEKCISPDTQERWASRATSQGPKDHSQIECMFIVPTTLLSSSPFYSVIMFCQETKSEKSDSCDNAWAAPNPYACIRSYGHWTVGRQLYDVCNADDTIFFWPASLSVCWISFCFVYICRSSDEEDPSKPRTFIRRPRTWRSEMVSEFLHYLDELWTAEMSRHHSSSAQQQYSIEYGAGMCARTIITRSY